MKPIDYKNLYDRLYKQRPDIKKALEVVTANHGKVMAVVERLRASNEASAAEALVDVTEARGPEKIDSSTHEYFLRAQYAEEYIKRYNGALSPDELLAVKEFGESCLAFISLWLGPMVILGE